MTPEKTTPKLTASNRRRVRRRLSIVVALFLIASAITLFVTLHDIRTNAARDDDVLAAEVRAAAHQIEQYLAGRQKLVQDFADENRGLLNELAQAPDNAILRQRIAISLRGRFPGHFTFTIADRGGKDLIDDLEGFVGAACVVSIRDYVEYLTDDHAAETDYRAVIHPQANNYHFDVMAPWTIGNELKGVFFVSFFPTALRSMLQAHQGPGHQLAIVNTARPGLLEVNAFGARDKISVRRDINLTNDEIARIKASRDIATSHWRVIGYTRPALHRQYQVDAWFKAAMILSVIGLVAGISAVVITRRSSA